MHIKILLTTLMFGLSVACSSEWGRPGRCLGCYPARSGEQLGTFQETNDTFAIRTLVFRERTFLGGSATVLGAHYIFETKGRDAENWRELMRFRHDNPQPIGEDRSKFVSDRVEFVSDRIAFVYMGWMYAVTTDAGETWKIWNGIDYPFQKGRMGYNGIQGVKLLENGVGTMRVTLIGNDDLTELYSKDYGVTWIPGGN